MHSGASSNTIYSADRLCSGQIPEIVRECAAEAAEEIRVEPKTLTYGARR